MKLQGKLVIVIIVAIVASMLLLAAVVFGQLRQQSERELFNQMQLLLNQTQQQTKSYIDNATANTRLFSSSNLMDRYVMVENEADRYELVQPALLRLFTKYFQAYPEYREIRLILPDGYEDTRVARINLKNLTEEEFDTPYFQRMLASGSNIMTTVLDNPDDGKTTLLISVPIFRKDLRTDAISTKPTLRGFMTVTASLDYLEKQIQTHKIGNNGYLIAVDRQHRIIFHPQRNMIGKDAIGLHSVTSHDSKAERIDANENTVLTQLNGESVYASARWLHPDLMLISVLPATEFRAASKQLGISVAVVSVGAIVLTSFILIILLRYLVVTPVRQLSYLAQEIGKGNHIDVSGQKLLRTDEIGDLARAFQNMKTALGKSMLQLQQSHAKIEQLAYRDSLTGLPNRRLFLELVGQAIAESKRNDKQNALLFLDLDDFKKVNDTLGHDAGDVLLQAVAQRLIDCVRDTDTIMRDSDSSTFSAGTVARIGGDEFIILINDLTDAMDAKIVAERVLSTLRKPFLIMDQEFVVGTSIGISSYPENGAEVDALVKAADTAMYAAKREQKNTYRFFGAIMQRGIQDRLSLERDLRIAVENESLTLHFQPQVDTHTRAIAGAEVLLRWHHPERGNVPPDLFIPIAEDMGLIGLLGEWIIDQTCQQWAQWNQMGIAPPRLAVNVSQRQFKLSNMVDVVASALEKHQLCASALEIEITESCMMEAPDDVVESLNNIRMTGVRIAMDDFGTGYSSLGALTSLPIDTLKIDRSFITNIELGKPNEKIVSAILSLAHNLGMDVVAEGVETQSEHQYLINMNCEICQGYLFSKPLSAEHMQQLLTQQSDGPAPLQLKQAS